MCLLFFWYADSMVFHFKDSLATTLVELDLNGLTAWGIKNCVINKVHNNLLDLAFIKLRNRKTIWFFIFQFNPPQLGSVLQVNDFILYNLRQVYRFFFQLKLPCLQPRYI